MNRVASEVDPDAVRIFASESAAVREFDRIPAPSLAAFLTNISHEIRTPLNGVLGLSTLLRQTPLDPTQAMYVSAIERSSDALLGVLSNLLEFAHLEAGTVLMQPGPVEIEQLAASALATIQSAADAKSIDLKLEMGEGAASTRVGDRSRIVQVLAHLLNNAVKFTQGGSVTLSVQSFGRSEDGLMRMTVADTGIGMSPVHLEAVMEGLGEVHGLEELPRGAGLGLLIAQRLARQMGGRIVATSELGRGSKFSLELPMGPDLCAVARTPVLASNRLQGLRILVVEDDSVDGMVLSAILTRHGGTITSYTDGSRVAEAIMGDRFDLAFLDLQLPSLDAIRCTRAVRDLPGRPGRIPVIGVTSAISELDRWACTQSGMTDFVKKPVCQDEIVEAAIRGAQPRAGSTLGLGRPA